MKRCEGNKRQFGAGRVALSFKVMIIVIFKKLSRSALSDQKHELIAESFGPDKARIASFLNVL